jgi:hypothetical protein
MTKWSVLAGFLFTTALAGCATPTKNVWLKDGASRQDFNRDHYECSKTHQPGGYFGWGIGGLIAKGAAEDQAEELRRACLRAQGWEPTEVPETSAVGFQEDDH